MKISGKFDVSLGPMEAYAEGKEGSILGRMPIDKTFHGELSAESKGEMLNAMTAIEGSAGYVAIEQVIGSLAGKQGSFVLQHFGIMSGGMDRLILEVVPDSGTGELVGLSGQHYYDFEYQQE